MGSPQPPPVMPQTSTTAIVHRLNQLPHDVQYLIFQHLDSFTTLHALKVALGVGAEELVSLFPRGLYSAIAMTEFAPLTDAMIAIKVLDAGAAMSSPTAAVTTFPHETNGLETTPQLVKELTLTDIGANLLGSNALEKLSVLNSAAVTLAELFSAEKGRVLSSLELFRFKRAVFRCATFFELYKEYKAARSNSASTFVQGEQEEEEDEQDELEGGDAELHGNRQFQAKNTFLAKFPHQEVLEMDCVREFMHSIADKIAQTVGGDSNQEAVSPSELAAIIDKFEIVATTTPVQQPCACPSLVASPFINESYDRHDDTSINSGNTNSLQCALQTPNLSDSLLLLGPIPLLRLYTIYQAQPQQTQLLKAITHALVPNPTIMRDIFSDEVLPFWKGLRAIYDSQAGDSEEILKMKEAKMPQGCHSIMEVMCVQRYQYAVLDNGRLFD